MSQSINNKFNEKTLVIDLDKTLLKIDLFKEALLRSLLLNPFYFFNSISRLLKSKASAKHYLAKKISLDISNLPYNSRVIELINSYKKDGYKIILATGATEKVANDISSYLGIFDKTIASSKNFNNVGPNKLKSLKKIIFDNFIYVGDSKEDLPIWLHCKYAIIAGNKKSLQKSLESNGVKIIRVIKNKSHFMKNIIKELRVHQWVKNLILFIPIFTSHTFLESGFLINTIKSFISFSLLASSIYLFNDIIDLNHDRKHPKNKKRPIASGEIDILLAYIVFISLLLIGFYIAYGLGFNFFSLVLAYILLNLFYSFWLKKIIILDVILLMSFYTLRLIGGHLPNGIPLSPWLLSFTIFLFFSLGLLKRYVDTITMQKNDEKILAGRGYTVNDKNILMALGSGSGLISALVLILYTGSQQVQTLYNSPMILVGLAPILLFWISRLWLIASRGFINSDPVLFAIKDFTTYLVVFCFFVILVLSKFS